MVYAVIWNNTPDLIKIGYSLHNVDQRYVSERGGIKKMVAWEEWSGTKFHEAALRALMGGCPDGGADWFIWSHVRVEILAGTEQGYLDEIAERISRHRRCKRCTATFFLDRFDAPEVCPVCNGMRLRNPLMDIRSRSTVSELIKSMRDPAEVAAEEAEIQRCIAAEEQAATRRAEFRRKAEEAEILDAAKKQKQQREQQDQEDLDSLSWLEEDIPPPESVRYVSFEEVFGCE